MGKKWTVEIEVDEKWIADGFDFTERRAHAMMVNLLPWATHTEYRVRILSRPPDEELAREMGYSSVEEFRKDRR